MRSRKFSNQTGQQIMMHLSHFMSDDERYNLIIDPMGVEFRIMVSSSFGRGRSQRREKRMEQDGMTRGERKKNNTKKSTAPKIRTVKKGRTVKLKGRA